MSSFSIARFEFVGMIVGLLPFHIWLYGDSKKWGYPQNHPFQSGIFHEKPSSYWGIPMSMRSPRGVSQISVPETKVFGNCWPWCGGWSAHVAGVSGKPLEHEHEGFNAGNHWNMMKPLEHDEQSFNGNHWKPSLKQRSFGYFQVGHLGLVTRSPNSECHHQRIGSSGSRCFLCVFHVPNCWMK